MRCVSSSLSYIISPICYQQLDSWAACLKRTSHLIDLTLAFICDFLYVLTSLVHTPPPSIGSSLIWCCCCPSLTLRRRYGFRLFIQLSDNPGSSPCTISRSSLLRFLLWVFVVAVP
ncbi:hypothetical protein Pyn_34748 [Prunus yedoensis var. nudiflora]|uniref:Uncharacterized protein n=1 Tax=Prunus yedoensis var. nudiflora TaxID=2094558 RepID=A0A314YXM7_PRUYE|nr:hypothetical protein Pyn_34748 [Prunus yedoensis var. nudiflora]